MGPKTAMFLNFDIDDHLNRFIPHPRLSRLPAPISRFLGVCQGEYKEPPHLIICFWSFVGAICGILTVGGLYRYAPGLAKHNPPVIVASLGASAILDYNSIRTPLAQPRNAFFGQTFSAVIGVGIAKLFQLNSDVDDLQWIAGAIACAVASLCMSLTNTTHPPGGATAILAATNTQIINMGWIYVPFIMLSSVIMLAVALILNNIQRQYPVYWWTPVDLRKIKKLDLGKDDVEKVESNDSGVVLRGHPISRKSSSGSDAIVIGPHHMYVPDTFDLDSDEVAVLARLQARLRWDLALDERPSLSGETVADSAASG